MGQGRYNIFCFSPVMARALEIQWIVHDKLCRFKYIFSHFHCKIITANSASNLQPLKWILCVYLRTVYDVSNWVLCVVINKSFSLWSSLHSFGLSDRPRVLFQHTHTQAGKKYRHRFSCNEIPCRDQRLANTHTDMSGHDSPHQTVSTNMRPMSMTPCLGR